MTKERKRLKKNQNKLNLSSMTVKELKQLQAKAQFLINNSTEEVDDYNYSIFYQILTTKLGAAVGNTYQPFPVFKKQTNYKKLIEVVDYLDAMVENMFSKPKRLWYRKLYRMYVTLIINDLQNSPIPLELPIVLKYKDKFMAILDNNFPGYLENGLLSVIFTKGL